MAETCGFNANYLDDDKANDSSDTVAASEGNVSSLVTKRIWQPTIEDTIVGVWEPPEKPIPHVDGDTPMSAEAEAEAEEVSETASDFIREVERSLYGDTSKDPENGTAEYFKAAENYSLFGANFMDFPKEPNVEEGQIQKPPPPGFELNSNHSTVYEGIQVSSTAAVSGQSFSGGPSTSGMGGFPMPQQVVPAPQIPQQQQHPRHHSPATVARVIAEAAALAGAGSGAGIDISMPAHCLVPTAAEMAIGQLYQQLMTMNFNRPNRQQQHQQQHQQQQQQQQQQHQAQQQQQQQQHQQQQQQQQQQHQQQQANQLFQQQQLQVANPGVAAAAMMYANIELQQQVTLRQIQLQQIRQQQQQQRSARAIYGANGKGPHSTAPPSGSGRK